MQTHEANRSSRQCSRAHGALRHIEALALLTFAVVCACSNTPSKPPVVAQAQAVIGPEGGMLRLEGASLEVPLGALREGTTLTLARLGAAAIPELELATPLYELGPSGTTFAHPLRVRLPVNASSMTGVRLFTAVTLAGPFVELGGAMSGSTVVGFTSHFTVLVGARARIGGQVQCESGGLRCPDGTCASLRSDPNNCGSCGVVCPSLRQYTRDVVTNIVSTIEVSGVCEGGACYCEDLHSLRCGDRCVDVLSSTEHCGACGNRCANGQSCLAGVCGGTTSDCTRLGHVMCGGRCVDDDSDPANCGGCGRACAEGEACAVGACRCVVSNGRAGTRCGEACVDLGSDPRHCGACGLACPSGTICDGRRCVAQCGQGTTRCEGVGVGNPGYCVALDSGLTAWDGRGVFDCGQCGRSCPLGTSCAAGQCSGCLPGFLACEGACKEVATDREHCGGCGVRCGAAQQCVNGACVDCGGQADRTLCRPAQGAPYCADLRFDFQNCGECGRRCVDENSRPLGCFNGRCSNEVCRLGETRCGPACFNTRTSAVHCGACGQACTGGKRCTDGACACPAGTTECGGRCVLLGQDRNHCGACGRVCSETQECVNGQCMARCPEGQTHCGNDSACTDLQSNVNACGSCTLTCGAGQRCEQGRCVGCVVGGGMRECNGECVQTLSDNRYCGDCQTACRANESCSNGRCIDTGSCSGMCGQPPVCTDLSANASHCGACGRDCGPLVLNAAGTSCAQSRCTYQLCNGGFADCDATRENGCETNVSTNASHCNRCDERCPSNGTGCVDGTCRCGAGTTLCGHTPTSPGTCSNTQTDAANCGQCGRACAAGQSCVAGQCQGVACAREVRLCEGVGEVNVKSSRQHCGQCFRACPSTQYCDAGVCRSGGDACGLELPSLCAGSCKNLDADRNNCGCCGAACAVSETCQRGRCVLLP